MSQFERMISGKLYSCKYPDSKREEMFIKKNEFLDEFNSTKYAEFSKREELCRQIFGYIGTNFTINKPLHVDYGPNIYIGNNFYANYDLIMLDVAPIRIGDDCMIGPRVSIYTAGHPIDRDVRNAQLEYGREVNIGQSVWIGGNTVICPGVTIGDNVVIGANSCVTKDIESNVVAAGNPCKVIRKISEKDKEYWSKQALDFYNEFDK